MLVAKHAITLFPRDRHCCFATISARVGSVSDNHLGGWYSYRASKAALNMMLKNLSIELARKYPHALVLGLHPGTVDTKLSKPFQASSGGKKLFTPEESAAYLLNVIATKTPADSGRCFAYDGSEIAP